MKQKQTGVVARHRMALLCGWRKDSERGSAPLPPPLFQDLAWDSLLTLFSCASMFCHIGAEVRRRCGAARQRACGHPQLFLRPRVRQPARPILFILSCRPVHTDGYLDQARRLHRTHCHVVCHISSCDEHQRPFLAASIRAYRDSHLASSGSYWCS